MGEAALHFATLISNAAAGGKVEVSVLYTTLDGITGTYEVKMEHHRVPEVIVVTREFEVPQPETIANG